MRDNRAKNLKKKLDKKRQIEKMVSIYLSFYLWDLHIYSIYYIYYSKENFVWILLPLDDSRKKTQRESAKRRRIFLRSIVLYRCAYTYICIHVCIECICIYTHIRIQTYRHVKKKGSEKKGTRIGG